MPGRPHVPREGSTFSQFQLNDKNGNVPHGNACSLPGDERGNCSARLENGTLACFTPGIKAKDTF